LAADALDTLDRKSELPVFNGGDPSAAVAVAEKKMIKHED